MFFFFPKIFFKVWKSPFFKIFKTALNFTKYLQFFFYKYILHFLTKKILNNIWYLFSAYKIFCGQWKFLILKKSNTRNFFGVFWEKDAKISLLILSENSSNRILSVRDFLPEMYAPHKDRSTFLTIKNL